MPKATAKDPFAGLRDLAAPKISPEDKLPWKVVNVVPVIETEVKVIEDPEDGAPTRVEKYRKRTPSLSLRMYENIFRNGKTEPREVVYSLDLPFRTDNCSASRRHSSEDIIRTLMGYESYELDFMFIPVSEEQLMHEKEARKDKLVNSKLMELEAEAKGNTRRAETVEQFPMIAAE